VITGLPARKVHRVLVVRRINHSLALAGVALHVGETDAAFDVSEPLFCA